MNSIVKKILLLLTLFLTGFNSPVLVAKTIKIATLSPEGTFWMKQMRAGAKEVLDKTEGRVEFKFYPGGVMGNDENVLRKIRIGQLHGGAVTTSTLSQYSPNATLYSLPFLFTNLDDAAEIRKTTDKMLIDQIEKDGFVNFGFAQAGFTYLMSKQIINNFDDLRKQKSWIPENSDVGLAVYRYIGVTPTSLPLSDVMTGLQTGLINNVITSPIGALALQWHTYVDYVVDFPLNYLTGVLIVDKKVFAQLSKTDQQIVREVMTDVYKKIDDQNRVDNIAAREALIKKGVKFVKLSSEDNKEWIKAGDFVIKEMIEKYKYDEKLYNATMTKKQNAPKLK